MNSNRVNAFKKKVNALILVALCMAVCNTSYAIGTCQIDTTPLDFGTYYPMQSMRLDSTATLNISCRGKAGSFQITTSAGLSNDFSLRTMFSGANIMSYNLYTNAARTSIWGDGSTNTSIITGIHPGNGNSSTGYTIYGSIGSEQNVDPGIYTDVITVTLFF